MFVFMYVYVCICICMIVSTRVYIYIYIYVCGRSHNGFQSIQLKYRSLPISFCCSLFSWRQLLIPPYICRLAETATETDWWTSAFQLHTLKSVVTTK